MIHYCIFYCILYYIIAEYAHECIKHILSLYENAAAPPKSVLLAGHSMVNIKTLTHHCSQY